MQIAQCVFVCLLPMSLPLSPLPLDFYLSISLLSVISSPLPVSLLGRGSESLKDIFVVLGSKSKKICLFSCHPAPFPIPDSGTRHPKPTQPSK